MSGRLIFSLTAPGFGKSGCWRVQTVSLREHAGYVFGGDRRLCATSDGAAKLAAKLFSLDVSTIAVLSVDGSQDGPFHADRFVLLSEGESDVVSVLDFVYRRCAPAGVSDITEPVWIVTQEDFDLGLRSTDANVRAVLWSRCRFFRVTQEQFEAALRDEHESVVVAALYAVGSYDRLELHVPQWFLVQHDGKDTVVGAALEYFLRAGRQHGRSLKVRKSAVMFVAGEKVLV